ncbi:YceI family protein [Micromonospora rubida]|uniref:YceI family protein n=1 Tax=Micromonospora rubida TaxID=2697657 RepID=UPI0013783ABE|nr:YceI family protein [Micromonospora rubida]NBE85397.1 polyisoprenoid-binding protein [Micromonospora rubida]
MTTLPRLSELAGDYVLDTAGTRIGFSAKHAIGTKVRGQFDEFAGSARLDGDKSRLSVEVLIQAASVQTGNRQRDEHLRRNFLNVDTYPVITFTPITADLVGEATFAVTGDLTIRGVTKPVPVNVELTHARHGPPENLRVHLAGSATINRGVWGVNWNAMTVALVNKHVPIEFDAIAIRTPRPAP